MNKSRRQNSAKIEVKQPCNQDQAPAKKVMNRSLEFPLESWQILEAFFCMLHVKNAAT